MKSGSFKMKICKSWFSWARGLMFSRKKNLMIEFPSSRKVSLHMFFVFFPINVYVLDSDKRVVEIKKNFKPFTVWNSSEKGKYVMERVDSRNYKIGEKVEF